MQFSVNSKKLKMAVKSVSPVLAMSVDASSIFKNHVCLRVAKEGITVIATNGLTKYQSSLTEEFSVIEEGAIVVVYAKLFTAVDAIKADVEISLALREGVLYIKAGKKEIELKTLQADDFTMIEKFEGSEIKFPFESTKLFPMVEKTMCREVGKGRMNGMVCQLSDIDGKKVCELKTTTGTAVTRVTDTFECDQPVNTRIVVPEFLVDESCKKPLEALCLTKNTIIAKFPSLLIQTPLPLDSFVNVDAVLNTTAPTREVGFKREELTEAVKFVKATSDKHDLKVKFILSDGVANVSSYAEMAKAKDTVPCESAENLTFTVNSENLLSFLGIVQEDDLKLQIAEKQISYTKDYYKFVTISFCKGA